MNDIDRRVAEIRGWDSIICDEAGFTIWYRKVVDIESRSYYFDIRESAPPYSTDQTLIGEMLAWLSDRGVFWTLRDDGKVFYGTRESDFPREHSAEGETINLALCNAIIAINTTPAEAGDGE